MTVPTAFAATVNAVYVVPGDGFDSLDPPDGNSPAPGATLGAQRKASFEAAADWWGIKLTSNVPIIVDAQMTALSCSPNSAILGSAGATSFVRDYPGAPLTQTWYHFGLGNKIANFDLFPGSSDVGATFNSNIDNNSNCLNGINWYYALGPGAPPPNTISFFDVVLHEIGHGVGVSTIVNLSNGSKAVGFDDIYMTFLEDHNLSGGTFWPPMNNNERRRSATDGPNTHFRGPAVQAMVDTNFLAGGVNGGHAMVYAPSPLQQGSSISHWDTSMADMSGTSEIMEPFAVTGAIFLLTDEMLEDLGWGPVATPVTFSIGGSVSGLAGSGLVLQNNGGDNLAISANGSFTFGTALTDGSSYSVTVRTPPTSPNQTCSVTSGSGVLMGANVTNVSVACNRRRVFVVSE